MKAEWEIPKYHFDGFFKLSCIFNDGCPIQDLIQSLHILGIHHIPNPYLDLMSITNGAKLFYDTEYGQSGLYLYDLNDIIKCNMNWQKSYLNKDLVDKDLIIGEFMGDSDLLILRCDISCLDYGHIIVSLPIDERKDWYFVSNNLNDFLGQFSKNHGLKYWEIHK